MAHTIDEEIAREARRLAHWQHARRKLLAQLRVADWPEDPEGRTLKPDPDKPWYR